MHQQPLRANRLAATQRKAARACSFSLLPLRGFVYAHGRELELKRGGMQEFYVGYGYGLGGVYEADVRAALASDRY